MNNLSPTAYQREDTKARTAYEAKVENALLRARVLTENAKSAIRAAVIKAVEQCDPLVNNELFECYQTERRVRATLDKADRDALLAAIMQEVSDHYFLPLNLMSEESNEQ